MNNAITLIGLISAKQIAKIAPVKTSFPASPIYNQRKIICGVWGSDPLNANLTKYAFGSIYANPPSNTEYAATDVKRVNIINVTSIAITNCSPTNLYAAVLMADISVRTFTYHGTNGNSNL